jgi:hypothetical protein
MPRMPSVCCGLPLAQSIDSDWPVGRPSGRHKRPRSLDLNLWLYRPTAFVTVDKKLDWLGPRSGALNLEEMKKEGMSLTSSKCMFDIKVIAHRVNGRLG